MTIKRGMCVFLSPASLTRAEHFLPPDSTEEPRQDHKNDFVEFTRAGNGQNSSNIFTTGSFPKKETS